MATTVLQQDQDQQNQQPKDATAGSRRRGTGKLMKSIWSGVRILFTIFYLLLIVLTVPISFQIGGVYCGLAFTVTLFNVYSVLTLLRLVFYKNLLMNVIYYSQHFFIPSLLTMFLSLFNNSGADLLKEENLFYYKFVIKPWRFAIENSTPWFTLLEGLCTVLAIQSIGHTFQWLKVHKSESWVIVSLLTSGGIITTSFYFLYRIYSSSIEISSLSASLIGAILTYCGGVGLYGMISKKGSTIESSLLFGYIVKCIYETFPELSNLASDEIVLLISTATNQLKHEVQHLPLILTDSLTQLFTTLTLNVPISFQAVIEFLIAASKTITPPVLFNLAYRVSVFYSATRIIPALKSPQPSTRSMRIIYAFAPCIVIGVYTHLMMQYSNELTTEMSIWGWWIQDDDKRLEVEVIVNPWLFWNWVNMVSTLALYTVELFSEQQGQEHWKID